MHADAVGLPRNKRYETAICIKRRRDEYLNDLLNGTGVGDRQNGVFCRAFAHHAEIYLRTAFGEADALLLPGECDLPRVVSRSVIVAEKTKCIRKRACGVRRELNNKTPRVSRRNAIRQCGGRNDRIVILRSAERGGGDRKRYLSRVADVDCIKLSRAAFQ